MSTKALTARQITDAGLDGWVLLVSYGLSGLQTRIHTKSYASGLQIVAAIGQAAQELDHQADLDLRPARVDVRLTSGYEAGGVTERDLGLARRISDIAAEAGVELECRSVSGMELAIDTPDHARIAPFWAALLDRRYVTGEGFADVADRHQAQPLIWFQPSGSEEPRQRWHLDITVDPTLAKSRVDAALAAGGTLVSDEYAPTSWTLADPDGNRVCLATWPADRDLP